MKPISFSSTPATPCPASHPPGPTPGPPSSIFHRSCLSILFRSPAAIMRFYEIAPVESTKVEKISWGSPGRERSSRKRTTRRACQSRGDPRIRLLRSRNRWPGRRGRSSMGFPRWKEGRLPRAVVLLEQAWEAWLLVSSFSKPWTMALPYMYYQG